MVASSLYLSIGSWRAWRDGGDDETRAAHRDHLDLGPGRDRPRRRRSRRATADARAARARCRARPPGISSSTTATRPTWRVAPSCASSLSAAARRRPIGHEHEERGRRARDEHARTGARPTRRAPRRARRAPRPGGERDHEEEERGDQLEEREDDRGPDPDPQPVAGLHLYGLARCVRGYPARSASRRYTLAYLRCRRYSAAGREPSRDNGLATMKVVDVPARLRPYYEPGSPDARARRPPRALPGTSATSSAARCATRFLGRESPDVDLDHRRPPRRDRGDRARVGRPRVAPGRSASAPSAARRTA